MSEKELTHRRERKAKRRRARKEELAKNPLKLAEKERLHVDAIIKGEVGLRDLYEPLLTAEEERVEKENEQRQAVQ